MTLKDKLYNKFEKKIVKSELDGETIYLAKGSIFSWIPLIGKRMKEWHQVYPPLDESKNWNKANVIFGGWRNLFKLIVVMALLSVAYFQYSVLLGNSKEYMDGSKYVIVERPAFEKYCTTLITEYPDYANSDYLNKINISDIVVDEG